MSLEKKTVAIVFLIVLSTFDAVVLPYLRLSIADISIIAMLFIMGITRRGMITSLKFLLIPIPLALGANAINYLTFAINHHLEFDKTLLISGFIRPTFFTILAINLYHTLKYIKIDLEQISRGISIGVLAISTIVFMQFIGYWPAQFHNNPSFGESGRWTIFQEGWRPTGLSNEASFVGIFLVLLLSLQLYIKELTPFSKAAYHKYAPLFTLLGCFFTTSRLSLLLGLCVLALQSRMNFKFLALFVVLLTIPFSDTGLLNRFSNLSSFDGDASTIERYGSTLAYTDAILSGNYILGTGYLNGSNVALKYAAPLVVQELGDRSLPAFSLPLQIVLELGLPLTIIILISLALKMRRYSAWPLFTVLLCSFFTGIQNFVFAYIFISLSMYVKNSLRK